MEIETRDSEARPRIRALIVDDEKAARERLRTLLADEPEIRVVGECDDGWKAVHEIQETSPDLVFLDVVLPRLDGFGVLENIGSDRIPAVVFVTADERSALRAFDVRAVDYVLKPFGRERLQRALERVRGRMGRVTRADFGEADPPIRRESYLRRILVKDSGRVLFLRAEDIDWIEASGNYLLVHVGQSSYPLRQRLGALEGSLAPEDFMRIHRSTIVNIDRIREMRSRLHGDYLVVLRDGRHLTMSASYRGKLDELRGRSRPSGEEGSA